MSKPAPLSRTKKTRPESLGRPPTSMRACACCPVNLHAFSSSFCSATSRKLQNRVNQTAHVLAAGPPPPQAVLARFIQALTIVLEQHLAETIDRAQGARADR